MSEAGGVVEFLIRGVTLDGRPFRPSDWAERLCGVMAAFGNDHRIAERTRLAELQRVGDTA